MYPSFFLTALVAVVASIVAVDALKRGLYAWALVLGICALYMAVAAIGRYPRV